MKEVQKKQRKPPKQQEENLRQINEQSEIIKNDKIPKKKNHDCVENKDQPSRKVDSIHKLCNESQSKLVTKKITIPITLIWNIAGKNGHQIQRK